MAIVRNNIKVLYSLFLLVYLFVAHQSLQNRHAHFYPNGMIVHSHPLNHPDKYPINGHKHSKVEICFYHSINFDYFSLADELHVEPRTLAKLILPVPTVQGNYHYLLVKWSDSRAPPPGIT